MITTAMGALGGVLIVIGCIELTGFDEQTEARVCTIGGVGLIIIGIVMELRLSISP